LVYLREIGLSEPVRAVIDSVIAVMSEHAEQIEGTRGAAAHGS
jgi:hypothetical protein